MSHITQLSERMAFHTESLALKHFNGTVGVPSQPTPTPYDSEEVAKMMYFPPLKMYVFADELRSADTPPPEEEPLKYGTAFQRIRNMFRK